MRLRIIFATIIVLLFLAGCNKARVLIDWVDFIQFNGITYTSNDFLTDDERDNIEIDEVYGLVEHKIADVVSDTEYETKNGDAAFHEIGTKVYSIVGYSTHFRLAIKTVQGIRLYEADNNPNALFGVDILDIKDKVDYITLNSETDGQTVIATIDQKMDVEKITNMVLESPIKEDIKRESENRYFLEFHLIDEINVTRCYWIDDGLLGNIQLPVNMKEIIIPYLVVIPY